MAVFHTKAALLCSSLYLSLTSSCSRRQHTCIQCCFLYLCFLERCRFTFCKRGPGDDQDVPLPNRQTVVLRARGIAPHPPICRRKSPSRSLDILGTRTALVQLSGRRLLPVNEWHPGRGVRLKKNFFRVDDIPLVHGLQSVVRTRVSVSEKVYWMDSASVSP